MDTKAHTELKCIAVSSLKKHGSIHTGSLFASLRFSYDEKKLLYVAERDYKTAAYFDADTDWADDEKWAKSKVVSEENAIQTR